ncbi:MAG: molybdate ABC transporter substrate-binding protein [Bacteroidia bacterium]
MRLLLAFSLLLTLACQTTKSGVNVAIAANLLLPFEEIVAVYESETQAQIKLISGASGSLTAQIEKGAPFEVFVSANERYAQHLFEQDLAKGNPINLIEGQLMLWRKSELDSLQTKTQLDPNIKIAIADPELAPYGMAAKAYLDSLGVWEAFQPNIVFGKSVGQVNQYLFAGVVDYAFTATAARAMDTLSSPHQWTSINSEVSLTHPFLLIKGASFEAERFVQYLQGETARNVFLRHGYSLKP